MACLVIITHNKHKLRKFLRLAVSYYCRAIVWSMGVVNKRFFTGSTSLTFSKCVIISILTDPVQNIQFKHGNRTEIVLCPFVIQFLFCFRLGNSKVNGGMFACCPCYSMHPEGFSFHHFNLTYYSWCLVPVWRL